MVTTPSELVCRIPVSERDAHKIGADCGNQTRLFWLEARHHHQIGLARKRVSWLELTLNWWSG